MATPSKTPRKRASKTPKASATETTQTPAPAPEKSDAPPATPAASKGKIGTLVGILRRPQGARIEEMMAATGWQAHSCRGALSGAVKKKLGLVVASEKTEAGRIYRIVEGASA